MSENQRINDLMRSAAGHTSASMVPPRPKPKPDAEDGQQPDEAGLNPNDLMRSASGRSLHFIPQTFKIPLKPGQEYNVGMTGNEIEEDNE